MRTITCPECRQEVGVVADHVDRDRDRVEGHDETGWRCEASGRLVDRRERFPWEAAVDVDAELAARWWVPNGYLAGREIGGGLWLCLAPMAYTTRLMVCDPGSVYQFWCYPNVGEALVAYVAFDGTGDPPGGWVKHHNRGVTRRQRGGVVTVDADD